MTIRAVIFDVYGTLLEVGPAPPDADARWQRLMVAGKEKAFKTAGKYACACGEGCDCGYISQKPGKCACDKDMVKVKIPKSKK